METEGGLKVMRNRRTAPAGARDGLSSSVACVLLSLYRPPRVPFLLPFFFLFPLPCALSWAPARKNFARERLAVYSANYSDTVYDPRITMHSAIAAG